MAIVREESLPFACSQCGDVHESGWDQSVVGWATLVFCRVDCFRAYLLQHTDCARCHATVVTHGTQGFLFCRFYGSQARMLCSDGCRRQHRMCRECGRALTDALVTRHIRGVRGATAETFCDDACVKRFLSMRKCRIRLKKSNGAQMKRNCHNCSKVASPSWSLVVKDDMTLRRVTKGQYWLCTSQCLQEFSKKMQLVFLSCRICGPFLESADALLRLPRMVCEMAKVANSGTSTAHVGKGNYAVSLFCSYECIVRERWVPRNCSICRRACQHQPPIYLPSPLTPAGTLRFQPYCAIKCLSVGLNAIQFPLGPLTGVGLAPALPLPLPKKTPDEVQLIDDSLPGTSFQQPVHLRRTVTAPSVRNPSTIGRMINNINAQFPPATQAYADKEVFPAAMPLSLTSTPFPASAAPNTLDEFRNRSIVSDIASSRNESDGVSLPAASVNSDQTIPPPLRAMKVELLSTVNSGVRSPTHCLAPLRGDSVRSSTPLRTSFALSERPTSVVIADHLNATQPFLDGQTGGSLPTLETSAIHASTIMPDCVQSKGELLDYSNSSLRIDVADDSRSQTMLEEYEVEERCPGSVTEQVTEFDLKQANRRRPCSQMSLASLSPSAERSGVTPATFTTDGASALIEEPPVTNDEEVTTVLPKTMNVSQTNVDMKPILFPVPTPILCPYPVVLPICLPVLLPLFVSETLKRLPKETTGGNSSRLAAEEDVLAISEMVARTHAESKRQQGESALSAVGVDESKQFCIPLTLHRAAVGGDGRKRLRKTELDSERPLKRPKIDNGDSDDDSVVVIENILSVRRNDHTRLRRLAMVKFAENCWNDFATTANDDCPSFTDLPTVPPYRLNLLLQWWCGDERRSIVDQFVMVSGLCHHLQENGRSDAFFTDEVYDDFSAFFDSQLTDSAEVAPHQRLSECDFLAALLPKGTLDTPPALLQAIVFIMTKCTNFDSNISGRLGNLCTLGGLGKADVRRRFIAPTENAVRLTLRKSGRAGDRERKEYASDVSDDTTTGAPLSIIIPTSTDDRSVLCPYETLKEYVKKCKFSSKRCRLLLTPERTFRADSTYWFTPIPAETTLIQQSVNRIRRLVAFD